MWPWCPDMIPRQAMWQPAIVRPPAAAAVAASPVAAAAAAAGASSASTTVLPLVPASTPAQDIDVPAGALSFRHRPHITLINSETLVPLLPAPALQAVARDARIRRDAGLPPGHHELTSADCLRLLQARESKREEKKKAKEVAKKKREEAKKQREEKEAGMVAVEGEAKRSPAKRARRRGRRRQQAQRDNDDVVTEREAGEGKEEKKQEEKKGGHEDEDDDEEEEEEEEEEKKKEKVVSAEAATPRGWKRSPVAPKVDPTLVGVRIIYCFFLEETNEPTWLRAVRKWWGRKRKMAR